MARTHLSTADLETKNADQGLEPEQLERLHALGRVAFQLHTLPSKACAFDLQDDIWTQHHPALLACPIVQASLEAVLAGLFPLPCSIPIHSGRAGLALLLEVWRYEKSVILQNHLSPEALFLQLEMGFLPLAVVSKPTTEGLPFGPELDLVQLEQQLIAHGDACWVMLDLAGEGHGGQAVSMIFLKHLTQLVRRYGVPLVLDISHLWDQCLNLLGSGQVPEGTTLLAVATQICAMADVVFGNLSANFGVDRGGILALRDPGLAQVLGRAALIRGCLLAPADRDMLAAALSQTAEREALARTRFEAVAQLHESLSLAGVPVLSPCGGHAVWIDVRELIATSGLAHPALSLCSALFVATGIRALVYRHSKHALGHLVQLSLPLGLQPDQHAALQQQVLAFFQRLTDLPQLERSGSGFRLLGRFPSQRTSPLQLPLTIGQKALFFLQHLDPEATAYNLPCAFRIQQDLDVDRLARCITALPQHHASLRGYVLEQEPEPLLILRDQLELELKRVDARGQDRETWGAWLARHDSEPFDLSGDPLVRATLFTLGDRDHILLLTFHHLIFDGSSLLLLCKRLTALYAADASLAPLPSTDEVPVLAAFARWQQELLASSEGEMHLAYWQDQLGDELPVLEMTTDFPRPMRLSGKGAFVSVPLPTELLGRTTAFARASRVSPFVLLLGIFKILLRRHSQCQDLVVGITSAGRPERQFEEVVGYFVNMLPLRTRFKQRQSYKAFVQDLLDLVLDAMAHGDIPFMTMVSRLKLVRDERRSPVFQAAFNLLTLDDPRSSGLKLEPLLETHQSGEFDLSFEVVLSHEPALVLNYKTDLYDRKRILTLAQHYLNLLDAALNAPDEEIDALSMQTPKELRFLLEGFNAATQPLPELSLDAMFAAQAQRRPDHTALISDGKRLSYAALDLWVGELAGRLQSMGVGPETPVGVLTLRSTRMVAAVQGIMRSGGAYVPLDPAHPRERITFLVEDARLALVLCDSTTRPLLADVSVPVIDLEGPLEPIDLVLRSAPRHQPNGLAYIMYTSGSTGQPKGVANFHQAVANNIVWKQRMFQLGPADRMMLKTPYTFDVSIWELFWPLAFGASLVIARPEGHRDPAYLVALILEEQVTTINFVPSLLAVFAETPGLEAITCLRLIVACGEAVVPELPQRLITRMPQVKVHNLYGPTEAAIIVTSWDCRNEPRTAVPIGNPIDNAELYVLDEQLRLLPMAAPGQLFIGGVALARCYHRRPKLTAGAFLPHPFAKDGRRIYATGDRVRMVADGRSGAPTLEYLGRIDFQVKLRGQRVELGEIEAALLRQPGISEAVVILDRNPPASRLVGFLIAKGQRPELSNLNAALAESLPEYMIPAALVYLDVMPLTPNGKANRKALQQLASLEVGKTQIYVAPRHAGEALLCSIWSDVLGRSEGKPLGIHDNFFECGGDSLIAIRAVARARAAGLELDTRALFRYQTVAELAASVERTHVPNPALLSALDNSWREHTCRAPLTKAQSRIWFLNLIEGEGSGFNMYEPIRLTGPLDLLALEAALETLVQRHEILRTVIDEEEGVPYAQVLPAEAAPLTVIDVSQLPQAQRDQACAALLRQWITRPTPLRSLPALHRTSLRLAPQEQVLLLLLHHILGDGWTLDLLTRELCTSYRDLLADRPSTLEPLRYHYADYAWWQQGLGPEIFAEHCAWWAKTLGDCPPILELPTDRPRPPVQTYHGALHYDFLPDNLVERLNQLARDQGVSLFMVAMAVFKLLMHRYSSQRDFAVGTPVANRTREDFERIAGLFMNAVVLRSRPDPSRPFSDFLAEVAQTTLGALAHQDVPFELLADALKPERNASHPLWFQVMLVLNRDPMRDLSLPGVRVSLLQTDVAEAKLDLTLYMYMAQDGIQLIAEYNTDLFDASTMRALTGHFLNLLQGVLAQPQLALDRFDMLDAEERQRILVTWNNFDAPYDSSTCFQQIFEAQAARVPDKRAVIMGETVAPGRPQSYTYGELNGRANALAWQLAQRGAGPEVAVGIYVDRSPELYVAILAVLKSGSYYVPLDPDYPTARLAYMLENAGAPLIISRRGLLESLPQSDAELLLIEDHDAQLRDNFATRVTPLNLVYLIYSSGSTGKPKGIALAHGALVSIFRAWVLDYRLDLCSSHLQIASFCFDVFAGDLTRCLGTGAKLVICPASYKLEPEKMYGLMLAEQVDFAEFVPAVVKLLYAWVAEQGYDLSFLRVIPVGSDAWTMSDFVQLKRLIGPQTLLINSYGVTEAAVDSTRFSETQIPLGPGRTAPIGKPYPNSKIYILDRSGQPVPAGVYGILYIGGPGLARSYFNQPGLTADKFLPDPFGCAGARLYCTNDAARYLSDGNIEFVGRVDNQVKLRGFRIELGEIEGVLLELESVREAAVQIRDDGRGMGESSRQLVAYVAQHPGRALDPSALRAHLAEKLPEYMVPGPFVLMEHLPLTPNGKTDHKALSTDPKYAPLWEAGATSEPAQTEAERQLAELWCQILGLAYVGRDDNFFFLGGHSLSATRLISLVRKSFGVELELRIVFTKPSLSAMAAMLPQTLFEDKEQQGPTACDRSQKLILSFAQSRLFFLYGLEGPSSTYNLSGTKHWPGSFSVAGFERAMSDIVRRHESLRTSFREEEAEVVQHILDPLPLNLVVIDYGALSHAQGESAATALAQSMGMHKFVLEEAPPWQLCLIRLGEHQHRVLWNFHHIITDGWSMGVLDREMNLLYAQSVSEASGHSALLAPLPLQYPDYAIWQRDYLQGKRLTHQADFWRRELAGAPASLDLPTKAARPSLQRFAGASLRFDLAQTTHNSLLTLAMGTQSTVFIVLETVFAELLGRYGDSRDVLLGTPVANRRFVELEPLIGFFVNTLVLRNRRDGHSRVSERIAQMRETTLAALSHQDLPFEKLVELLNPVRDTSRSPIFQVMFTYHQAEAVVNPEREAYEQILANPAGTSKFDLALTLVEHANGIAANFDYNTDLFEARAIATLARHFQNLLAGFTDESDAIVADLPMLDQEERQHLCLAWNQTQQPQTWQLLHESIVAGAHDPDAIALIDADKQISFCQLRSQSLALAERLRGLGMGPELVVGLGLGRGSRMALALLAVLRCGACFLPLDPTYPVDRLEYMLADSGCALLISDDAHADIFNRSTLPLLNLDHSQASHHHPMPELDPAMSAYLLYTSGSTGRPKGVRVSHGAISNRLRWAQRVYPMARGHRLLQIASFNFDIAIWELFGPLIGGATCVFLEAASVGNPQRLLDTIADHGITHLHCVPSLLEALLEEPHLERAASLEVCFCGGEALSLALIQTCAQRLGLMLQQFYGPTEAAINITATACDPAASVVTLGRPIDNAQIYLVDPYLNLVPLGVSGELVLSGLPLARGYQGRPAHTAERFVPNPFSGQSGARLYRTGDRARLADDGQPLFLGRTDFQVKIRGHRIEPDEIARTLQRMLGVPVYVLAQTLDQNPRLLAFALVRKEDPPLPVEPRLRELAAQSLPEYMVPSRIWVLESLPVTANGKLDRQALLELALEDGHEAAIQAPRNPAEGMLLGLFAEILGRPHSEIDIHANFFSLGGHSLSAARLAALVRKTFQVELDLRLIFSHSSVAALAQVLSNSRREKNATASPKPSGMAGPFPLSFAQSRMYFLYQMEGRSATYNMPGQLLLPPRLDTRALERALGALIERHESLRSRILVCEGQAFQAIVPYQPFHLGICDFRGVSQGLNRLVKHMARRPFNLEQEPLYRFQLLRLNEGFLLCFNLHHIISDGWSMELLSQEARSLYDAFASGAPRANLPRLRLQYSDYSLWQAQHLGGELLERQVQFWKAALAGAPASLDLPYKGLRPLLQRFGGASCGFVVGQALARGITQLAQATLSTSFLVLETVFAELLGRYGNSHDVLVGTPVANRPYVELEALIGLFVNTLVLRNRRAGHETVKQRIASLRHTALDAFAHQDLPFEKLVEALNPARDTSRSPVFQVMFSYVSFGHQRPTLQDLGTSYGEPAITAKFDLSLTLTETAEGLNGSFDYNTALFEPEFVALFARHFLRLLEGCVAEPDARIAVLPILGAQELDRLCPPYPRLAALEMTPRSLHQVVADLARSQPNAPALVAPDRSLSYGALDARASRLAQELARRGVGLGQRVGVALERSPESIIAFLAILRVGAAYLPIDPKLPPERSAYMLEDSRACLVITHSDVHRPEGWPQQQLLIDQLSESDQGFEVVAHDPLLPAYLIYTSGSTGKPKGVVIPHRGLAHLIEAHRYAFELRPNDHMLQGASLNFDASIWEILLTLGSGATLHLAPAEQLFPGPILAQLCEERGLTHLFLTPGALAVMPEHSLSNVRTLFTGGEACSAKLVQTWAPGRKFFNVYGPTEISIYATLGLMDAVRKEAPTLGTALAYVQALILDDQLQIVPAGVMGELCISGAGLAQGYFQRARLSAAVFVPNPFAGPDHPGTRLYRSGDLAQRLPNGEFVFGGRMGTQVKIRGHRIELGEIQACLQRHGEVAEAAVFVQDLASGKSLTAAVVPLSQVADLEQELNRYLSQQLPSYMVPSQILRLEALPRTINGKIDVDALKNLAPKFQAVYSPPQTTLEQELAEVWCDLLHLAQVGRDDNFFNLGGHSLLATRMVAAIGTNFAREVPLRTIFENPVLRDLAACIEVADRDKNMILSEWRGEHGGELRAPLTFMQQRLFFLDRLEGSSLAYHIPSIIAIEGLFSPASLQAAFDGLLQRHEALRTRFCAGESDPYTQILPYFRIPMGFCDLSRLKDEAREALAQQLCAQRMGQPFRLEAAPPLRAQLFRLKARRHLLLLEIHHIIADGWSFEILARELNHFYSAHLNTTPVDLPRLKLQYPDFAHWQATQFSAEEGSTRLDWWTQRLAETSPVLELPLDRPRPLNQTFVGESLSFLLSPANRQLMQRCQVTPFMLHLAAFAVLLERYSGQTSFNLGMPVANRTPASVAPLIGFFANTLVLPLHIDERKSFSALLAQVRALSLDAFARADVPFEKIVDAAKLGRDLSRSPLFQVMFSMDEPPSRQSPLDLPGASTTALALGELAAKFDLELSLVDRPVDAMGTLIFNRDLFDRQTLVRWMEHFCRLLQGMNQAPERPIWSISMLDAAERHDLLTRFNQNNTPYPDDETLPQIFARVVASYPQQDALIHEGRPYSYVELDQLAYAQSLAMVDRGIGAGDVVGLGLSSGPELIVNMLAVLRCGACYLPLDLSQPQERLAFMIEDAQARLLVLGPSAEGRLTDEAELPTLAALSTTRCETVPPPPHFPAHSLAYIMYTSGSTGQPKGVCISHRNIARTAFDQGLLPILPGERLATAANPAFDAMTLEVWPCLLKGGTLLFLSKELALDSSETRAFLEGQHVDHVHFTAALFSRHSLRDPAMFHSLKTVLFGGEAVDPTAAQAVLAAGAPQRLLHCYGPTESTVLISYDQVTAGPGPLNLGRPLNRTQVYLVDTKLQLVPFGAKGELVSSGAGLAQCYLNRPGLTALSFVPNPFASEAGDRLYRTGDQGRYLADGRLVFMGRGDHQVKIRGYRIEPGEIAHHLNAHPAVNQAHVLARSLPSGDLFLVAYVSLHSGAGADQESLRKHLSENLPDYMIPTGFVFVERFPLTPNGKLNVQALPEFELGGKRGIAPRSGLEWAIAHVWSQVLGLDLARISVEDNFFELGGHSLLALRMAALLTRKLELDDSQLPLKAIFDRPTLAGQASFLAQGTDGGATLPAITRHWRTQQGNEVAAPLSWMQQRLWFIYRLEGSSPIYNIPFSALLLGRLSVAALNASLETLVARHESLRSHFRQNDGEAMQIIQAVGEAKLECVDLSAQTPEAGDRQAKTLIARLRGHGFKLEQGPLLRMLLVRVTPLRHHFLFVIHHMISDGWSQEIIARELSSCYSAALASQSAQLAELPLQYADFAHWQRFDVNIATLNERLEWWRSRLTASAPVLALPADHARPALQSNEGTALQFTARAADRDLLHACQATAFMGQLATLAVLLSRYSGQTNFNIATPIANRTPSSIQDVVGFFANTLVLPMEIDANLSYCELLRRVRELTLASFSRADVPFERIVEAVNPERDLSRTPLFQVIFSYHEAKGDEELLRLPGIRVETQRPTEEISRFDLEVALLEQDDQLRGTFLFNRDLFEAASVRRWCQHFANLTQALMAQPNTPLWQVSMLDEAERSQLLGQWSGTVNAYPQDANIAGLFEHQVTISPRALALETQAIGLDYDALNRQANQCAHRLAELGLKPGQVAALCMPRGSEAVWVILAILKCGATYLPLDVNDPAERKVMLLEDSDAVCLLTTSGYLTHAPIAETHCVDLWKLSAYPQENLGQTIHPLQAANIIYTHDATGVPKGVVLPHRALLRLVRGSDLAVYNADETYMMTASLAHELSTFEIWGALLNGARLVPLPDDGFADLSLHLRRHKITVLWLMAPLFQEAVERDLEALAGLHFLLVGGETLAAPQLRRFLDRFPEIVLIHGYGPTETSSLTSCGVITKLSLNADGVPLGPPSPNTSAFVVGAHLELAPLHGFGELAIGGVGLAWGYLNRPGLTAERFVPDPFSIKGGERLYRTGDRTRWLLGGENQVNGVLIRAGRMDRRVKQGGVQVELGGIEAEDEMLSPTAKALAELWCELLGVQDLHGASNFFSLGGHSLLAITLTDRIAKRFGVALPLASFFAHPRLGEMAELIEHHGMVKTLSAQTAIRLNQVMEGQALFLVHPIGGQVFQYRDLAQLLRRPVYAFQAAGLIGEAAQDSVAAQAARYICDMRIAQAQGPYLLGAWSYGGLVAHEMARQLLEQGEEVSALVLVDSHLGLIGKKPDVAQLYWEAASDLARSHQAKLLLEPEELDGMDEEDALALVMARVEQADFLGGQGLAQLAQMMAVYRANASAASTYQPAQVAVSALLLQPEDGKKKFYQQAARLWRAQLKGRLKVAPMSGDHFSCFTPGKVENLAELIEAYLRAPQRKGKQVQR